MSRQRRRNKLANVDLPNRHKFGYAHLVEMRDIERGLRTSGLSGVELHFAAVRQYEVAHRDDPTYRERQAAWKASATIETPDDLLRKALEEIRDGHNDPRALAREVLEASAT